MFDRDDVLRAPIQTGIKPRIIVFSTWNDAYAPLAEIARPNWTAYCAKNGYGLRFYPGHYHEDPSKPETFGDKGKFEIYYDIRGLCDVVMWLDIDSLFMNHNIRIEDVLSDKPFVWTYDDSGPLSGLWIARTDLRTEGHLRYAYAVAARENNVRHGKIEPNGISDQDAMTRLMNVPPFSHTFGNGNCLPAVSVGHCYESNYEPGDWILTWPGMPVEEKLERMKSWSNR